MSNQDTTDTNNYDVWLTTKLISQAEPAFTEPAVRSYIFGAVTLKSSKGIIPGNGLEPHICRLGKKVLLHHGGFRSWYTRGAKLNTHPKFLRKIDLSHGEEKETDRISDWFLYSITACCP